MDDVARLSPGDRGDLFQASAAKRGVNAIVIEKDFWVCWLLKRLFLLPDLPAGVVFKGGTSLSKVWNLIDRLSEDVDLSVDRADLGFVDDTDPARAGSAKKRNKLLDNLADACAEMIRKQFVPMLTESISKTLSFRPGPMWWLEIVADDPQTVLFHYPLGRRRTRETGYVRSVVKLEFGARGEHWPSHWHDIQPFAAADVVSAFSAPTCRVKVVDAERTFWEKATILHMWHNAPADKTLTDRQSRHYYDVAKLYATEVGRRAIKDTSLLQSVAAHKAVFFHSKWAKYDEARPGTLRLIPPEARIPELERDYTLMRESMTFGIAPTLDEILAALKQCETEINSTA